MKKRLCLLTAVLVLFGSDLAAGQTGLDGLDEPQNYRSRRVSPFDRTGGNDDRLHIPPGETAVLADILTSNELHWFHNLGIERIARLAPHDGNVVGREELVHIDVDLLDDRPLRSVNRSCAFPLESLCLVEDINHGE